MSKSPKDVLSMAKENEAKILDLRFTDFPGMWQHFSVPIDELTEELFEEGLGFDGSSIRGWQAINESDMLVIPDPVTAFMDPFTEVPTLVLICDIHDPITHERYTRNPRNVAQKAVAYMESTGLADSAFVGPEAEFFIFDDIRFDQNSHEGYYHIDSVEGRWNTGRDEGPNLGYKPRIKEGYFPVPPTDHQQDIRTEMVLEMAKCGLAVEAHHHEVATGGQAEIDMRFGKLVRMGDQIMMYKYIIKNVARRHGKTVTFMPKPLFEDNGSGMHTHISLWKDGKPPVRRGSLRRSERDGAALHRRPSEACSGDPGVLEPDDELV